MRIISVIFRTCTLLCLRNCLIRVSLYAVSTSHHPVVTLTPQRLFFLQLKLQQCCAIQANKKRPANIVYSCLIHTQKAEFCLLFLFFSPPICLPPPPPLSLSLSACPQGTFKSFQGAGLCQQCPLNSRSTIEAATLCGCRNGYYRGDMDKPEDMCTSESLSLSAL